MSKLLLTLTLTLGIIGTSYGAPVSFIFNNTTQSMTVFAHDRSASDACQQGRAARPDAGSIEVAKENEAGIITYTVCE